ncbi:BZ3500_MvSof-1268-A1-R1_Chr5-3g08171 [Microbotryum saponariae]|uniref:BZ3500_MvSof-1268-A1-R1_Chr5-3g08171 protein n=1 Tax=Microbotryum saponariae TaxID=289078 RepID=A0A2X0L7Y7_9BASI|nr:BZ3500_MvSof-1268-A1-R1_Chr5-3g08171 [Microbotryum saponariae]SDA07930.1 BZ3501_MvSof-1269-A2-R1_Chr5-1g07315 [Microbotryum saponariae]
MTTKRPVLSLQTLLHDQQQQQQTPQRLRSTSASNDARPTAFRPQAHQLDQSILESPIQFVASPRALSPVQADFHFPFHPSSTSLSRPASRQGSPRPKSASARREGNDTSTFKQIFGQLDRIDQLQKQLAIRHAELEKVASGSASPSSPQLPPPQPAPVEPSLKSSSATAATEEGSVQKEKPDDESSKCRADYDELKKSLDDRRPRMDQMMTMVSSLTRSPTSLAHHAFPGLTSHLELLQLEELSTALKTFHALPTPMTFPQTSSAPMSPVFPPFAPSKDRNEAARSRTIIEPSARLPDRRRSVQRHLSYS